MAFNKKNWVDQNSEYPQRRKLTNVDTGAETTYDVQRAVGAIETPGDRFDSETMNDLEDRIATDSASQDQAIQTAQNLAETNADGLATLNAEAVKHVNGVAPTGNTNDAIIDGDDIDVGTLSNWLPVDPEPGDTISVVVNKLTALLRDKQSQLDEHTSQLTDHQDQINSNTADIDSIHQDILVINQALEGLEEATGVTIINNLLRNPNTWGLPGGITGAYSFKIAFESSATGLPTGWGTAAGSGLFVRQTNAGDGMLIITRDISSIDGNTVELSWKAWNETSSYWSPWRTIGGDLGSTESPFNNGYFKSLTLNGKTIAEWPTGESDPVYISDLTADPNTWGLPETGTVFKIRTGAVTAGLPSQWGTSLGLGTAYRYIANGPWTIELYRQITSTSQAPVEKAWKSWVVSTGTWTRWRVVGVNIGSNTEPFGNTYASGVYSPRGDLTLAGGSAGVGVQLYSSTNTAEPAYMQPNNTIRDTDIGRSTRPFGTGYYKALDLNGETITSWPTGGGSGGGKRYSTLVVGNANSGHTLADCDFLYTEVGTASTVINSAIQALGTGGGEIVILEGQYVSYSGTINFNKSNVTIRGMGASTELVKDFGGDLIRLSSGADNCCVKSLSCSYTGTLGGTFISVRSNNNIIDNCVFNTSTAAAVGIQMIGLITNCKVTNCSFLGGNTSIVCVGSQHTISGNYLYNFVTGITISSGYSVITGNVCFGYGASVGINTTSNYNNISGNMCSGCQLYGIQITGGFSTIVANSLYGNTEAINPDYDPSNIVANNGGVTDTFNMHASDITAD